VLISLQAHAKELLVAAQSSSVRTVTRYVRRFTTTPTGHDGCDATGTAQTVLNPREVHFGSPILIAASPQNPFSLTYEAHDKYHSYFYSWAIPLHRHINTHSMDERWKFQKLLEVGEFSSSDIDERPCRSPFMWLFASVTIALEAHLSPEGAAFAELSQAFDKCPRWKLGKPYSDGEFTERLRGDMRYWSAFANMRGMKAGTVGGQMDLESLTDRQSYDLDLLLSLLVGNGDRDTPGFKGDNCISVLNEGPAATVARSLANLGLLIMLNERTEGLFPSILDVMAIHSRRPADIEHFRRSDDRSVKRTDLRPLIDLD